MKETTPSYFRLPTAFVDSILPGLSDTAGRVLLVVLRQTHGWKDRDGNAKKSDWITSKQMCRRVGRQREAVSGGIDILVRRGLLLVTDITGRPLSTPSDRRRCRGKLLYSPGPVMDLLYTVEQPSTTKRIRQ